MLSDEQKRILKIVLADRQISGGDADQIIDRIDRESASVEDIATPGSATAEDVANKVNELMAALRAAEMLAE